MLDLRALARSSNQAPRPFGESIDNHFVWELLWLQGINSPFGYLICSFSASLGFAEVHVIQIAEVSHMQIVEGCWVGKKTVYCAIVWSTTP